jgi:DNA polymerase III alpha subunit
MMWTIEFGALRMGLGCIKGVGKGVQIVKTDPKGGIKFFMHKNRTINKGAIEPIIKAGCFAESRRWSLEYATWAKEVYSRRYECQQKINDYTASGKVKLAKCRL